MHCNNGKPDFSKSGVVRSNLWLDRQTILLVLFVVSDVVVFALVILEAFPNQSVISETDPTAVKMNADEHLSGCFWVDRVSWLNV